MAISKIILNGVTQIDLTQDTVTSAEHIVSSYIGHLADGTQVTGTGQGGGSTPSATAHTIYFEFTDETNTTITAYYDSSFISDAITATTPTTYGSKTVTLAQLDGVTWYENNPNETWETVFDGDIRWTHEDNGDYPYCWIGDLGSTPITVGSIWRVTYNNVEYRCTAKTVTIDGGNYILFGNPLWFGGVDDGSNVPFAFNDYTPYGAWSGGLNAPNVESSYYFKIERLVTS